MTFERTQRIMAERDLRNELLRTYDEYCKLLVVMRDFIKTYVIR
ncbi:MAG: hypothetical protein ABSA92_08715 [Candidatus Bathyarchaeia archaeon]